MVRRQWEYAIFSIKALGHDVQSFDGTFSCDGSSRLGALGLEGWELVTIYTDLRGQVKALFKRELLRE